MMVAVIAKKTKNQPNEAVQKNGLQMVNDLPCFEQL